MKRGSWWEIIVHKYFGGREGPIPVSQKYLGKEDTWQLSGTTLSTRKTDLSSLYSCACSLENRLAGNHSVENEAKSMIGPHSTHMLKVKMGAHTGCGRSGERNNKMKLKILSPQLRADENLTARDKGSPLVSLIGSVRSQS